MEEARRLLVPLALERGDRREDLSHARHEAVAKGHLGSVRLALVHTDARLRTRAVREKRESNTSWASNASWAQSGVSSGAVRELGVGAAGGAQDRRHAEIAAVQKRWDAGRFERYMECVS